MKRILLIDDDEPTIILNKMVIEEYGQIEQVHTAATGDKALQFLNTREQNAASPIDLILLDLNMPGMDGYEFMANYQQLPAFQKAAVVIVMLTTSINKEKKELLESLGISGFRGKPLTEDILTDIQGEFFN